MVLPWRNPAPSLPSESIIFKAHDLPNSAADCTADNDDEQEELMVIFSDLSFGFESLEIFSKYWTFFTNAILSSDQENYNSNRI